MRYVEPHAHMVSRTTDNYKAMVVGGSVAEEVHIGCDVASGDPNLRSAVITLF
jgi:hypothetical protein